MCMPSKLYKYRLIDDFTKDIILNRRVYFCAPADFNDPFDCKMPLDFSATDTELQEWVTKVGSNLPVRVATMMSKGKAGLTPVFFEQLKQKYVQRLSRESSVFCVSEQRDDILMFAHYANGHKGCCLEFDFTTDALLRRAEQVAYQQNYPDLNYFRLHGDEKEMGRRLILTKASRWQYEKEWRAIRYRVGAGLHSIKPSCLTGIIFGANASAADRAKVRQWVSKRGVPLKFYEAKVDSGAFKLNIVPIP
jgi:hypothetical protein